MILCNGAVIPTPIRKTVYKNMALNLADDPSLVANYLRTGKKLIMYHGYGDPIISPYRTVLFFEDLAKLTGGYDELRRAARLFMVPDMGHCSGSTAPDEFGNGTEPAGYPVDAQHDVLTALEAWVEKGQPPSSIIATHYSTTIRHRASSTGRCRSAPSLPRPLSITRAMSTTRQIGGAPITSDFCEPDRTDGRLASTARRTSQPFLRM